MPYYKNARMLVSTSLGEGLPLSLIGGLYYETPIVASNVSGNKDVINSKCAILHDNTLNELIYSIKFLLSNDSFDYRDKIVAIRKGK